MPAASPCTAAESAPGVAWGGLRRGFWRWTRTFAGTSVLRLCRCVLLLLGLLSFWSGTGLAQTNAPRFAAPVASPDPLALPDLLRQPDGSRISGPVSWYRQRPQLLDLLQTHIYGRMPPPVPFSAVLRQEIADLPLPGARYQEWALTLLLPGEGRRTLLLALFLPAAAADGPVPLWLGINKCGNTTLLPDPRLTRQPRQHVHPGCVADEPVRGSWQAHWPVAAVLARGQALASFAVDDLEPDQPDAADGLRAQWPQAADPAAPWGALAVWAWGLQRALDFLVTLPEIDPQRLALTGWSRFAKAALLAAASDSRVSLVVPHQSGTGGSTPARLRPQERIASITHHFPHWFTPAYAGFAAAPERLPLDQHGLLALLAPRPLLDSVGRRDTWASPELAARAVAAAQPVYALFPDGPGRLQQRQADKDHDLDLGDWMAMLDFAQTQWQR
ncbi:MAG: hypothetical protein RIR00_1197 [Pseudomonadota bacterium]|jgi:hypothetical protein